MRWPWMAKRCEVRSPWAKLGAHLPAANLPSQGVVLAQIQAEDNTNEITQAPKLLQALDLRKLVATGDAMHAQRRLSLTLSRHTVTFCGPQKQINRNCLRRLKL